MIDNKYLIPPNSKKSELSMITELFFVDLDIFQPDNFILPRMIYYMICTGISRYRWPQLQQ